MTEETGTEIDMDTSGLDPEDVFEEGFNTGQELASDELLDNIANRFEDEGFDPDEIDELLYDPAPRRRRRRSGRRRHRSMDPAPRRRRRKHRKGKSYDPAPRRGRRGGRRRRYDVAPKRRTHRSKGMLKDLLDNSGIITYGGKFIMDYAARADVLKAAGSITTGSYGGIFEALQYDIANFKMADATTRVQKVAVASVLEGVAGMVLKSPKINNKMKGYGKPLGDALIGYAAAVVSKAVLDPPVVTSQPARRHNQPCIEPGCRQTMHMPALAPARITTNSTDIPWGY